MEKFKFYLSSALIVPELEVFPIFKAVGSYKMESPKIYHSFDLKDDLHFTDAADIAAINLHKSTECGEMTIRIESLCKGNYSEIYVGVFEWLECRVNEDVNCFIDIKPTTDDAYRCFDKALDKSINIFYAGTVATVEKMQGDALGQSCLLTGLEWLWNIGGTPNPIIDPPPPLDCFVDMSFWWVTKNETVQTGFAFDPLGFIFEYSQQTWVARETFTRSCFGGLTPFFPQGGGWELVEDNCGTPANNALFARCLPSAEDEKIEALGPYYHGRNFAQTVENILSYMGCGLSVKSDFFNINKLGDAPTNIAYTYADEWLKHLTIHQKSDIKVKPPSYSSLDASTALAWNLKPQDFFDDLEKMFNVRYKIVDGVFILEHYSFFTTTVAIDATNVSPQVKEYGQSGASSTKSESYKYADELTTEAFIADPIGYDCGDDEDEIRLSLFSVDLVAIENDDNFDSISDEGFVLIANDNTEGVLNLTQANQPLSWKKLHENLFQHGRKFKSGTINGEQMDFLSHVPYIEQNEFPVKICCDETFDPNGLVKTFLGDGLIGEADRDFLKGTINLKLLF